MILALMLHCPSDCFAFRFGKAVPLDINFAVFYSVINTYHAWSYFHKAPACVGILHN